MSILSATKTCLTVPAMRYLTGAPAKSGVYAAIRVRGYIKARGRIFCRLALREDAYLADVVTGTLYDPKTGRCLSTRDPEMQIDLQTAEKATQEDAIAFARGAADRVKRRELAEYEERGITLEGMPV